MILLMCILLPSCVLAADGDDKGDEAQSLTPVRISIPDFKKVTKWSTFDSHFFPESQQKYALTLDLKDTEGLSLFDFNELLCRVAKNERISRLIGYVELLEGTSFRFNKIKPGLSTLIQQNPDIAVKYVHTGIQTPATPKKTLRSIASTSGSSFTNPSAGVFVLVPKGKTETAELIKTEFSKTIKGYEVKTELESLEAAFLSVEHRNGLGNWPPFEITEKDQIIELHSSEIATYRSTSSKPPTLISVTGMRDHYFRDLRELCDAYTSIKALRIVDSTMEVGDLDELLPLIGTRLKMIDVSSAFSQLDNDKVLPAVQDYLKGKAREDLLEYFAFNPLSPRNPPTQKLMDIINEYAAIIKSGGNE